MPDYKKIFLDLNLPEGDLISDETAANIFLSKFQTILPLIGKRKKHLKTIGMAYDVPSVALYDQAKDLYCLGYFISAIILCRSAAEYLAYEIFIEEIELGGKTEIIETVADNLDFRKIVNEFLFNKKRGYEVIDEATHDLFNEIYDLGNKWIHPKKHAEKVKIEEEALNAINTLNSLLSSLRDVTKDYDVTKGKLIKRATARKKIRPIILGKQV